MVKRVKETTIKDGIVSKLLINRHQDKENIMDVLSRHSVMKI